MYESPGYNQQEKRYHDGAAHEKAVVDYRREAEEEKIRILAKQDSGIKATPGTVMDEFTKKLYESSERIFNEIQRLDKILLKLRGERNGEGEMDKASPIPTSYLLGDLEHVINLHLQHAALLSARVSELSKLI